jgi:acetylglutamate kinase
MSTSTKSKNLLSTEDATRKAAVLIEALPYLKRFHQQVVVVKLGGEPIEDPECLDSLLTDLVFLEQVGVAPVLVHGGGKSISRAMDEAGLKPVFHKGRRVTDEATMQIVARESERLNLHIVDRIFSLGGAAICMVPPRQVAVRSRLADPEYGLVGLPVSADRECIMRYVSRGLIPVLPPLTVGPAGQILNTNADDIALMVASGLNALKLVFMSSVPGVMTDPKNPATLISSLTDREAHDLFSKGVIKDGMIPKLESCLSALRDGVQKIHIVGAAVPHALLLEIFTDKGIGTELRLE